MASSAAEGAAEESGGAVAPPPAAAAEEEEVSVELPAPPGWKKKAYHTIWLFQEQDSTLQSISYDQRPEIG